MNKTKKDLIFWHLLMHDVLRRKPTKRVGALERNYEIKERS